MADAKPEDWPRSAPVLLTLIALGAAGTAVGIVTSAAGWSPAGALATAEGAIAGVLATGLAVAYVRIARRTGTFTFGAMVITALGSFLLAFGAALVAWLADGTPQAVAKAVLAGAVVGMTVGSLLWRRSVIRAQRAAS